VNNCFPEERKVPILQNCIAVKRPIHRAPSHNTLLHSKIAILSSKYSVYSYPYVHNSSIWLILVNLFWQCPKITHNGFHLFFHVPAKKLNAGLGWVHKHTRMLGAKWTLHARKYILGIGLIWQIIIIIILW